jgi:hypothetical protein
MLADSPRAAGLQGQGGDVQGAPHFLDDMQFRFNRRKKSDLFTDTLRHMVTADPLTFERLTA